LIDWFLAFPEFNQEKGKWLNKLEGTKNLERRIDELKINGEALLELELARFLKAGLSIELVANIGYSGLTGVCESLLKTKRKL
jgi:hypothetical protein